MNELMYFNAEDEEGLQGYRTIQVSEGVHPYWSHWWPAGHVIGYEIPLCMNCMNLSSV